MASTSLQALREVEAECMSGEDEFTHFGRTLASQLRQLPLPIAASIQNKMQNLIHEERMKSFMGQSSASNGSLSKNMADQLSAEKNVERATKNFAVFKKYDTLIHKSKADLDSCSRLKDFKSDIYKIELGNLPDEIDVTAIEKFLKCTLKFLYCEVKTKRHPPKTAFIIFTDAVDRDRALKVLNGVLWKDKALSAKIVNPPVHPMAIKRIADDSKDCPGAEKKKRSDIIYEPGLKHNLHPCSTVPYEEQLKNKEQAAEILLFRLGNDIISAYEKSENFIHKNRLENSGLCCPLIPIKPSPVATAYRNQCDFTVGRHLSTKKKTVGFHLNSCKKGPMSVVEPDDCITISITILKAVKSFQEYIRLSEKDVYNPETGEGFWNNLTVRTSSNSDILLIILMHPQTLSEDELEIEKCRIKEYYEKGPGHACGVTSIYIQLHAKRTSFVRTPDIIHLMGSKVLEETLLGLKFKVNPKTFFPINVPAAEILHSMVTDFVQASPTATVFDICYETCTISLCLAKAGRKVINIGMDPEAVKDARINAEYNNLSNVEFLDGSSTSEIITAINKCGSDNIIAIVVPPNSGLDQKILKAIRANEKILKLIFISSRPELAFRNLIDLCRPPSRNLKRSPFYPVQAAVVDTFPYTPCKELVLVFERQ